MIQASHGKDVWGKEKFSYQVCERCGSFYLVNIKTDKLFLQKYYSPGKYYRKEKKLFSYLDKLMQKYSNNEKRKILEYYLPKERNIKILDVGCGDCQFLKSLGKDKYERCGIDINKNYIDLRADNINITTGDFFDAKFHTKFDVVTMWHVFEHLKNPDLALKKIRSLLNRDGICIISTPNPLCLGNRFGGKKWFHTDAPRHLTLFTESGIRFISQKTDFKVIGVKNIKFEFPLDLFWSVRGSVLSPLIYLFYPLLKLFDDETFTYVLKRN